MAIDEQNYEFKPYGVESLGASAIHQLFQVLLPLTIGLLASAALSFFSHDLVSFFFGTPVKGIDGYITLAIVLLPFLLATAYSEWSLRRNKDE